MKSVEVKFAFLADAANLSQEGKLNAIGVFEAVFSEVFPLEMPNSALVLICDYMPADAGQSKEIDAKFLTEDGTVLGGVLMTVNVPPPPSRVARMRQYHIVPMQLLKIPNEGNYEFSIEIGGRQEASIPLQVRKIEPHASTEKE